MSVNELAMQSQDTQSIWVSTNDTHCRSACLWQRERQLMGWGRPSCPSNHEHLKKRLDWLLVIEGALIWLHHLLDTEQNKMFFASVCVSLQSANCDVAAIVSPLLMMHCYSSRVSSSSSSSLPPPLLLHTVSTSILKHMSPAVLLGERGIQHQCSPCSPASRNCALQVLVLRTGLLNECWIWLAVYSSMCAVFLVVVG